MTPSWLQPLIDDSPVPQRAALLFHQLAESWPSDLPGLAEVVHSFADQGRGLVHLLSVSPVSAERIATDPSALVWLSRGDIHDTDRGPRRMLADYEALQSETTGDGMFDARFRVLRRWKGRQMLRIALREVAGSSTIEQTTAELTNVAEFCVQTVSNGWLAELGRKWGEPKTGFAVLGMGKFGGQELNYSSDIDVIFFFGDDGQLNPRFTHQEFFARLAEKIIATFSTADPSGTLFRIDLRLRPEGASGPLVRSLDSMENYYAAIGETWERMALIKSRVVGGDEELGYEFAHRLQPFIYPRAVSMDVLEEIRAIKGRIEREIVGQDAMHRNVKLGYGGIREIEFVTQTLQILHGAKHAFLQERSTLKALRNLRELDLLPQEDMETLIASYRWLRTVEHRLQIEREAQTHTLPESEEALRNLAASLVASGAIAQNDNSCLATFQAELAGHTSAVRTIFDKVLAASRPDHEVRKPSDLSYFHDPESAGRALEDLGGPGTNVRFSPRTKKLFLKLEPLLLDWLRRVADPDVTLNSFVRFVQRYGIRGMLYETLLVNPRVLEVLVRLFDASRSMTEIMLRRPQLMEEVARKGGLGESLNVADYLAALAQNEESLPWQNWVRSYRQSQILRIGLRDVLGFANLIEVQREISSLAEACLLFTQEQLGYSDSFTVVAMGKFGGQELGYGADLDVVFVGDQPKAVSELMRAMSELTAEGIVFPIDARLRPEGESGPLCVPLSTFDEYYQKRAQLWEAQALTKARPVSGPLCAEYAAMAERHWRRFGAEPNLLASVGEMHHRVVRERTGAEDLLEFKTGSGGLMQVEFFTQSRQMRAGIWEPNTIKALATLVGEGFLRSSTAEDLSDAYQFLRQVEFVLRRQEDKGVSALPKDEAGQRAVAIRCGFESRDAFLERYSEMRHLVREKAVFEEPGGLFPSPA